MVFLEVQFQSDTSFYGRWFAEIYLYLYRQMVKGEWRAVVVYPRRATETAASAAYGTTLANPWVHRVYLDEALPQPAAATHGLGLIHLILAGPEASATQAKDLVRNAGAERDWILDWVETILVYKFPKLSREEIRMLLDLKDPDLRKSRFFQEVYAEGREDGRRSEAALVLRQLRRRLGLVTDATQERIAALSSVQLEALGEALLDFAQPSDLDAWLGQYR